MHLCLLFNKSHDIAWKEISPYSLRSTHSSSNVRCRGCKKEIPRNLLRIVVDSKKPSLKFKPMTLSFCLKKECLEKQPEHKKNSGLIYPDFNGIVMLSDKVQHLFIYSIP